MRRRWRRSSRRKVSTRAFSSRSDMPGAERLPHEARTARSTSAHARRTASISSSSLRARRSTMIARAGARARARGRQCARAGEDDVVLLDPDPARAVEQRGELRKAVRRGVVRDALRASRVRPRPGRVELRHDDAAAAVGADDDGEEPLELERPEARQVGDRLVGRRDERVEPGLGRRLAQPLDAGRRRSARRFGHRHRLTTSLPRRRRARRPHSR